ncbi:hypothetical protein [Streptomyces sp. NPDC057403]|uniref:hypothetical protein n=1 Tax=Streptomyces sp. NPDC057403 TaxID=3346119 RepID=UPI0036AB7510
MRRNPYRLLGIFFGAGREEANIAFVRRTRALRRGAAEGDPADLTWALNQIDEAKGDPADHMDIYRVPAVPAALDEQGPGVFHPEPERMRAVKGGDVAAAVEELRERAAVDWLTHLVALRASHADPPAP